MITLTATLGKATKSKYFPQEMEKQATSREHSNFSFPHHLHFVFTNQNEKGDRNARLQNRLV